ncbi:MAG: hypothetical protein L0H96_03080 [Humibacillus sp.]|nr:hypothetical protein [Humibacillus sp.]MDN5775875.1 hypothetical protein [Humibacillus sp.]
MTTTAHAYLDAVVHRTTSRMEPDGFRINWLDAPRKGKFLPGVESVSLDRVLPALDDDTAPTFTATLLGELLKATYAEGNRRLAIHCNDDVDELPHYGRGSLARGTASGGARYPVSIYWVAGPSSGVTPGVYYYNVYHHSMERLLVGDLTPRVAAALGADRLADQYLVLGLKYWQNAFKYHNFAFHAVSMDIGTITHSWRSWLADEGLEVTPHFWFDEPDLADLLSIDLDAEGVFAVLPLGPADRNAPRDGAAVRTSAFGTDEERSRTVLSFPMTVGMQRATAAGCTTRPTPVALSAAAAAPVEDGIHVSLPSPEPTECTVAQTLLRRRSSFGRFIGVPMRASALAALLDEGTRAGSFPCDASGGLPTDLLSLYVFVNRVEGVAPGAYRHDSARGGLVLVDAETPGVFLQKNYALDNYNVEQAGAVIVPAVRVGALMDAVGDRGYRLASAVVGATTQAVYQAAAARDGVGCGAALGFDNAGFMQRLHLDTTDTIPLIMIMVGSERAGYANYRSETH